jgi:hypothetical protein
MDYSGCSVTELVGIYSDVIKELRTRGILRTNNVIGELGEYLVMEYYLKDPKLPTLSGLPVGTQNVNAISQDGMRYSIKSISSSTTGAFYGLEPPESKKVNKPLFEFLVICKFGINYEVEGIYQLSWDEFLKYKKWNSHMQAWNIQLTQKVKQDSLVVFEHPSNNMEKIKAVSKKTVDKKQDKDVSIGVNWNLTKDLDHTEIRKSVAKKMESKLSVKLHPQTTARYVDERNELALFISSASYSTKNKEYWYSINDENIPWLEDYPKAYVAFALGGQDNILLFSYKELKELLKGCLHTDEDLEKKKIAHYHFSFAVEGKSIVYFKKKIPERDFVNVADHLIQE